MFWHVTNKLQQKFYGTGPKNMEMNRILNRHDFPAMNHTTYTSQLSINLSLKIGPYEILKRSEVGHQAIITK